MTLNLHFFMVLPKIEIKYSRTHREWTAWNDDLQIVAAGRTKKEALEHWRGCYFERIWRNSHRAWTTA